MSAVQSFDFYAIIETIIGIEFIVLAIVAMVGVMNIIRMDYALKKRRIERVEILDMFYKKYTDDRQRKLEEKTALAEGE